MKNVLAKILLLLLCFVFAFTGLVACGTDELEEQINGVQDQINQNDKNDQDDAKALAELKTLVEQVKATADAAATKAALDEAVADLTELTTAVDGLKENSATKAKLEEVKTALETALAANATADAETKTALENAINAVKATAEAAATKTELANKVTELENKIKANADADTATKNALTQQLNDAKAALEAKDTEIANSVNTLKTNLEGQIAALETKVNGEIANIKTRLDSLEAKDTELAGLIAALKQDVETLKNADALDFLSNYEAATQVLNGKLRVVVENGKVVKLVSEDDGEDAWNAAKDYSLETFHANCEIDDEDFSPIVVADFKAYVADVDFFLSRATSVESIVALFGNLDEYKANDMPDLVTSLTNALAEKVIVKALPVDHKLNADYKNIVDTVELINNKLDDDITNYPQLKAQYDTLVAAYNNILAADAAKTPAVDAITAIGYVVYTDSEDEIAAAKTEIDAMKATYFNTAEWNAHYEDDETTIITNYATYTKAVARYEQLDAANTNKVVINTAALNYNNVRPLWTAKADLDANLVAFEEWLAEYELDETLDATSLATMYPASEIELLDKAIAYATAMDTVYNTVELAGLDETKFVGVAALNEAVDALVAKTPVLWTDKAESDAYVAAYAVLKAAVEAVADFPADLSVTAETNYAEMVTAARADAFKTLTDRHFALDNANAILDMQYDNNIALKGYVDFQDWDKIEAMNTVIAGTLGAAGLVDAQGNYLTEDPNYVAFAAEKDAVQLHADLVAEYRVITQFIREIYDTVEAMINGSTKLSLAFGNDIQLFLAEISKIMDKGVTDVNLNLPGTEENGGHDVNLKDLMDNLQVIIKDYEDLAYAAETAATAFEAPFATLAGLTATDLNDYDEIVAVYTELQAWINTYLAADVTLADGDVLAAVKSVAQVTRYLPEEGETQYYNFVTEAEYTETVDTYTVADNTYKAAETAWKTVETGVFAQLDALTNITMNIHNVAAYDAADAAYVAYVATYYAGTIEDGVGEFGEVAAYTAFTAEHVACDAMADEAETKAATIEQKINALVAVVNESNYEVTLVAVAEINALLEEYKGYCPELCTECLDHALLIDLREKEATAQIWAYAKNAILHNPTAEAKVREAVGLYVGLVMIADNGVRTFEQVVDNIATNVQAAMSDIDLKAPVACSDVDADGNHDCDVCGATGVTECVDNDADGNCDECGAAI